MHDKLHWKLHVSFEWAKSWSQIRDSRKLFASRLKSVPYRIDARFYASKTILYVAKHAQSKCETWSFVVRNMPSRGSRRHLSQLDTCLTAKTKFNFGASVAQNRRFRSLFHPKTSTNFLSKNMITPTSCTLLTFLDHASPVRPSRTQIFVSRTLHIYNKVSPFSIKHTNKSQRITTFANRN